MVENYRPLDLVNIRGNIHLLFIQICEQKQNGNYGKNNIEGQAVGFLQP